MIEIRFLPPEEIVRIAEIDRTEQVSVLYTQHGADLVAENVDITVPPWPLDDSHPEALSRHMAEWKQLLTENEGVLIGAFDGQHLSGFAIYRPRIEPDTAQLAVLHVSRAYRRSGVATWLVSTVEQLARKSGARCLYVSATPTNSALGFYTRWGFIPTDQPISELLALEPEDIHMRKSLEPLN